MDKRNSDQMVYVKDLLFAVLYRWKVVLTVSLVLALLLGGLQLLPVLGGKANSSLAQKSSVYETEKAALNQRIQTLQKTIDDRQTHLEQALLMTLDPYNHYEAQVTVSVQLTAAEAGFASAFDAQALLEAYREVLTEEACLTQLAEILQQPIQYTSELIGSTVPAIGSDTITFKVKCADSETAAALADAVKTHLEQYQEQISQNVAPHTLFVLKSTALATADSALAETQRVEVVRLAEMLSALKDAQNKRKTLVPPSTASGTKKAVLYGIIGAFAGMFLTVCALWAIHIGTGKVYSARTLHNRTGVKILGCIDSGNRRGPVQKWLRKLEGRCSSPKPNLIATDISLRNGEKKLLVTGTANAHSRKALAEALKKAMPAATVSEAPSVLEAPEALEALASCDAVVLVEQCGSSRYQNALRQADKYKDYGKPLIGCVVVDG